MSGPWEIRAGYPQRTFGLGQNWIPLGIMDMLIQQSMSVLTSRGSYGPSWESVCGGNNEASTRTI